MLKLASVLMTFFCLSFVHARSIDYTAEHILEGPMDMRYLSFPNVPLNLNRAEKRGQLGLMHINAEHFDSNVLLMSGQYYKPLNNHRGLVFGSFLDFSMMGGRNGVAVSEPNYVSNPTFVSPIDINIKDISGWSYHLGVSGGLTENFSQNWSIQYGIAFETLRVQDFEVSFDTLNQSSNFSGKINYKGNYNIITPYFSNHWRFTLDNLRESFALKFIVAYPLPRVGFKGSFYGGGTNQSSNSEAVGKGTHIPDPFIGLGLSMEDPESKWIYEIGASLYTFFLEGNLFHRGLGSPIFLSIGRSF